MSQKRKKIVSKGDYVKAHSKKAAWGLGAMSLMPFVVLCCFIALYLLLTLELKAMVIGVIVGIVGFALFYSAVQAIKQAQDIDSGVPLTRANTSGLPADESLVRASEQPIIPQQDVLLRPTTEMDETPAEQLLRPS